MKGVMSSYFDSNKTFVIIFLSLVFLTSGCGTVTSRYFYEPYEYNEYLNPSHAAEVTNRVYSGLGWHFTAQNYCDGPYKISGPCQWPSGMGIKGIWYFFLEGFATFDYLFLSSVADTVILPITILETCCTGDLSNAAAQGDLDLVQQLLDAGEDVNDRDAWGHTPLMSASWAGHRDMVKLLLKRGAEVNASTRRDWTALRFAKKLGHPEIVDLLKGAGAKEEEPLEMDD